MDYELYPLTTGPTTAAEQCHVMTGTTSGDTDDDCCPNDQVSVYWFDHRPVPHLGLLIIYCYVTVICSYLCVVNTD